MYLVHHGILGQKWGIRRYQNEDGTLTEAGKRRLNRDILANAQKKKENRVSDESKLIDPDRWVQEDIGNAKNIADASSKLVGLGKDIEKLTRKEPKNTSRTDSSMMSDKELRDRINRMMMEKQYADLTRKPEQVSKGRKIVTNILEYSGAIAGVVSSSLGIALAVQKLKG